MLNRIAAFLVGVSLWVTVVGLADEPFTRAREQINSAIEQKRVASLAVAVAKDGKFVWEEGFGLANVEKQIRATAHTPYSIASISKPITATALMILVERKQVELDRPANDYFGDVKLTAHVGNAGDATLRRVANHTSGLPLHFNFFYEDEPRRTPDFDESLRRYGHLLAPPGEEFQYANFGYGILDDVIRRVSKRSYAEFLAEEVFRPLAMRNTSVGVAAEWQDKYAQRYHVRTEPLPMYGFDHPGGSAVYSSAHDLVLFGLSHLKKCTADQRPILSSESIDEMQRPTANLAANRHYGVGWFVDTDEYGYSTVSHSGGMGGVRCRLVMVPDQQIVVATVCNSGDDLPMEIAKEILGELLPDYGTKSRKEPDHIPNAEPPRPFAPPELVGFWQGAVETYRGRRNLELWVQSDGDVKVRYAGALLTLLNQSQLHGDLLTGVFSGRMGTDDADYRPHHLQVRLRLRGEVLNGAVTAMSLPGKKPGNALSHWAELRRVSKDPETLSLTNGHNLDGWRVLNQYDFQKQGGVSVEDGAVVFGQGNPATGISWMGSPSRMNYEITLQAKRLAGSDFFCGLTFPVNEHYLSLILGGWGGGVTGLSNLNDMSAVENETTGYREFQLDRWYSVRLRVTPAKVQVWLDDDQIIDVETADRKMSIWWEQEPVRPLGVASWNTKAAIRNFVVRKISGE